MKLTNILISKQIKKIAKTLNVKIDIDITSTIKIIDIEATIKGQGSGTKLLNFIKTLSDSTDKKIVFDVDSNNQTRLIKYYNRLGFKLITTHHEYDDDMEQYMLKDSAMMSGKFYPLMSYN